MHNSNLKILLKNNFNILLGTLQGKKNRKSTTTAVTLLVFGVLAVLAIYSFQAWSMISAFSSMGVAKLGLFHGINVSLTVAVIVCIMRPNANEKSSDSDFLLSLPITKKDIIISKIVNKFIFDFSLSFLLFFPFLIIYFIFETFSITVLLLGILIVLLLPFLSVGVSCVFEFLINRLFNKTKFSSVIKSLFAIVVFISVFLLMTIKQYGYGSVTSAGLNSFMADRPVSNFIFDFLFNTCLLNSLIIVLVPLILFAIGLCLYAINFGKTFSKYASKTKELKFKNKTSSLNLLLKKEFSSFVTTPAYLINTIIGPILMVILSVLFCLQGENSVFAIFINRENLELSLTIFILILCSLSSMTAISCSSISLEGKSFWFLKSMPINIKTLFLSKILNHFLIVLPFILVSVVLLEICFAFSAIQFVLLLLIPIIFTLIMAISGLFINLWVPKMQWDNPTAVVKQSLAVLLSMVFGLVLIALPVVCFIVFKISLSTIIYLSLAFYIITCSVFVVLLNTIGKKLFEKIE